ncbi:MAG TPA: CopG family ribbon-helix-helix protein [Thermoplasmata archaeon]|nr:CopG family ribbon-helix-helix protein [Thermoplasmata archaeon]
MPKGVVRVGVSLEPELLRLLDAWVHERNSPSRSDAVRTLIRQELANRTLTDPNADALGVVALLYRPSSPNVLRRLTAAEHRWGDHVRATTHVHLRGDACAEVVILMGHRREIETAAENLRGVKGILEGGWLAVAPSIAGGRTGHRHPHASPRASRRSP